jgi:hypothetical protein
MDIIAAPEIHGFPCIPRAADGKEGSTNEYFWTVHSQKKP